MDKIQLALGAATTIAGTLQMMEGMFVTLAGLATVPAPGLNIGSPVAVTFGLANVAVGGANAVDGVNQMIAAVGGPDRRSTFGTMGQAIGGHRGGQLGDAAAILGNVALGIPGLARSVTASNRAGEYALANFALDSMTGVAAEAAGSRCP